jgi:hypothetical protein
VEVSSIIAEIDSQISKLQQARALLAGGSVSEPVAPVKPTVRRGRPKGSKNSVTKSATKAAVKVVVPVATKSKRKLSPEGRKRIAEAMKKRWAERRKQVAK